MFKFAAKVGVTGGICYYLAEEGLWKESEKSVQLYSKISKAVSPYCKEVSNQVPITIPDLPNSERISYLTKQYWNCGVTSTFQFLINLPQHVRNGVKSAGNHLELQKMLQSFKTPPAPVEPTKN